jgi:hypothetical protein
VLRRAVELRHSRRQGVERTEVVATAGRRLQPGGHGASTHPLPSIQWFELVSAKRPGDWEDNLVGFEASVAPPPPR